MLTLNPKTGNIIYVNGPVVKGTNMKAFKMQEMVLVGSSKLIGEVISIDGSIATLQVYEETEGLGLDEEIKGLGNPLSINLGPGLLGNIFDGIGRPLDKMKSIDKNFIPEGIGLTSLDFDKEWKVSFTVEKGDNLKEGSIYATVEETELIQNRLMIPPGQRGEVIEVKPEGKYKLDDILIKLKDDDENIYEIKMYQEWPVRKPRPTKERLRTSKPLVTGQRVIDSFFPIAKGGTAAIPGGFGTGKTITQHQLAKWSDADIIIYIGCGERGNEMTDVLEEFPKLQDPSSEKPLMERTILIANTSNMPVAAREASIYTGITMAEYYRDMGYNVAIMADSTSRWAEALREISGRLEEMPAEGGYPAYLASRLAQFYERAGYFINLNGNKGSITTIGAVSPAGGDFSEPVTENTKRFVNVFLALDKKLANERHYPAINWLESFSGYIKILDSWYKKEIGEDFFNIRNNLMEVLQEENKLQDIVQLVGKDVLPDSQRLILEIGRIIKVGFLQQNAFHDQDKYVPIKKQYEMLKLIYHIYKRSMECIKEGIPVSKVKNEDLFDKIIKIKYTVPNEDLSEIYNTFDEIDNYYNKLKDEYSE